jgi:hypothetical protein
VQHGDLAHGGGVERPEGEGLCRAERGEGPGIPACGHHERGRYVELVGKPGEHGGHLGPGPVRVVQHDEGGARRRPGRGDGGQRRARRAQARRVRHEGVLTVRLSGELRGQPGLAHAWGPRQRHQGAGTPMGALPARAEPREVFRAAGERRSAGGVELAWEPGVRGDVEHGVLAEDRLVQAAELGSWLDPDLLHERVTGVAIRLQRGGLPATAVQREHPLPVEPLAQRVDLDQRVQARCDLGMPSRGQVGLDGQLRRLDPQLLEPADRRRRERLVGDVREGGPAPQRERVARGVAGRTDGLRPARRPPGAPRAGRRRPPPGPPAARSPARA